MPVQRVPRNLQQQQQAPNVQEFQGDPADVRKLIMLGVLGLMITFGSMGGALYLINRPTTVASDDEYSMPSARGLMLSLASGGKVNAHQYDKVMGNMCQQLGERSGDSIATANCRKAMRGAW